MNFAIFVEYPWIYKYARTCIFGMATYAYMGRKHAGMSIEGLFLGGTAHADDVRAIATSTLASEAQGNISNLSHQNGHSLNYSITEIVKVSNSRILFIISFIPSPLFSQYLTPSILGINDSTLFVS